MFLFTTALFLSGYALQQQTVRDLRAAIRPKETPKQARLYLPPQFAGNAKPSPKERGRGEEIVVEVKQSESQTGNKMLSVERHDRSQNPVQKPLVIDKGGQNQNVVELPPSIDSETMAKPELSMKEKPLSRAERRKRIKEEIMAGSEEAGFKGYRRRMW